MADLISRDLMMEDIGKQQNDVELRRENKNFRPDNKYCREVNREEAAKLIKQSAGTGAAGYDTIMRDVSQAWDDLDRETLNYEKLLKDEKSIEAYHARYVAINVKKSANGVLTTDEENILGSMNSQRFETWLAGVRENRMSSGKVKASLRDIKDKLVEKSGNLRAEFGTTLVWQQHGRWYTKYAKAPEDSGQSLKRQKEQIAREFVQILTTVHGLTHLDYFHTLELMKEYRDVFPYEHQQNKVLNLAIQKIEKNKIYLTRKQFAEYCFEALEPSIQWEFNSTLKSIMANKDQKYEINLPADRDKRIGKLTDDKKDFRSVMDKRNKQSHKPNRGPVNKPRFNNQNNSAANRYNASNTGRWPKSNNSTQFKSTYRRPNWGTSGSNQGQNNSQWSRPNNRGRGAPRGQGRGQWRGGSSFRARPNNSNRGRY